ncbi:MAG: glycoside hydrolase family 15 protein, partial [Phycisphaerales bacterium]
EIRLFFCQDFNILGSEIGDTALYRPEINALLHYKSNRWFLINCFANKKFGFDSYATGKKDIAGEFGTWMDAQDGILSENPIAQGSVDSAAEIRMIINPNENDSCFYWICAGLDWDEVRDLNGAVIKKKPQEFLKRTINYWRLWVDKEKLNFSLLPDEIASLYKKSLLICRTQINNNGSIIAANDSEIKGFNPDTYSYMWPRDGALTANALDLAGYFEITRKFYKFCARVIEREGYFMHKYTPIGSLGSSWLPWVKNNKTQLPIQEDETALVLWALWENFNIFHEIEFIKPLYKPLIKNAADFMMNYRDLNTGLPLPSYDLWEERRGVLTFTTAAVYGGLMAAANFTRAFGDVELARAYSEGAQRMRKAMDEYMYLKDEKRFCKMINFNKDGSIEIDKTIDASVFGTFAFGAYEPGDDKVKSTMQQVYDTLWCKTKVGGIARYKHDTYFAKGGSSVPGNPWFVTTLWLAYYYVVISKNEEDLSRAMDLLKWVQSRALPSGVLAEQVDPLTNEPLSVSPLTWSHSTFILVVQAYLNKLIEMHKCPSCGISKYLKNIV